METSKKIPQDCGVFKIPYKTVEDIPLSEYKNLHKAYWTFISENKLLSKPDIFSDEGDMLYIKQMCFACEYAIRKDTFLNFNCLKCPIKRWNDLAIVTCTYGTSLDNASFYVLWQNAMDYDEAAYYALRIADLYWED